MAARRVAAIFLGISAVLAALLMPELSRWLRAGEMLTRLAHAQPPTADTASEPLIETDLWLPAESGPIRARLYRPSVGAKRGVVIAHGVHHQGIDERRLVPFARELARAGVVVLTPELDDLTHYEITDRGVEVIRQSVRHLSGRRDLGLDDQVGILGFSFAGGLSIVAATVPDVAERVAFVTSVGGHHDLERVLDFLISGSVATPLGIEERRPHEYGLVILTYQHLDRFVPEVDHRLMRDAFRAWLKEDRVGARAIASQRTTEEAERLFALLESQELGSLRPALLAIVAQRKAELRALSPRGRLGSIGVPVYLLHGTGDSVIPPSEAQWAARELDGSGLEHASLVTPLLEHVAVEGGADWADKLALVQFMSKLL